MLVCRQDVLVGHDILSVNEIFVSSRMFMVAGNLFLSEAHIGQWGKMNCTSACDWKYNSAQLQKFRRVSLGNDSSCEVLCDGHWKWVEARQGTFGALVRVVASRDMPARR